MARLNEKCIDPNKAKAMLTSLTSSAQSGAAGGAGKGHTKITKGRSQKRRKSNKTP